MSYTKTHAERELDILVKTTPDVIIEDFIPEILALCEKFGNSGQSGGSAPYTASAITQAINKLLLQQTICPLQGTDDEWNNSLGGEDNLFQNNRDSAVFKDDNGAYYLDAIIWKTQNGTTWGGTAKLKDGTTIRSRQFIKSFPFEPKTFYIDVIETEIKKDDWEFTLKDEEQLTEVFEYYKN